MYSRFGGGVCFVAASHHGYHKLVQMPSSRKHTEDSQKKLAEEMQESTLEKVHSSPTKVHRSRRKSKAHSRHEHRCHKARHKSSESLLEKADRLHLKHYLLNNKLGSGVSQTTILSPFEMNVSAAYQHVKNENNKLKNDLENLMEKHEEFKQNALKLKEENDNLKEDVSLLKNLVYKLNVELEKYQSGERKPGESYKISEKLPRIYEKNLLKPISPLLKAYSETIQEKEDIIRDMESEYKKFNQAFNDLLQENEKLYAELEKKFTGADGGAFNEARLLKKDLEMAKQENNLLFQQIKLEKEKLAKVHSTFKFKVEEVLKEKEGITNNMEECKAELYVLRGKYVVIKQELERLQVENDTRVPAAVHSASINECRRLFQDLKNEYENEKQRLTMKLKELEGLLTKANKQGEGWEEEKNFLEKSNFNQALEIETLRRKISELENQLGEGETILMNDKDRKELIESRKQLREKNKEVEELSKKLSTTKKQLQKAMVFAEDIVRGQEGLLLQLHAKQKENNYMTTQFGSLKNQLKNVERDAQEGLNSIEDKIRSLESENHVLSVENRKLEKLLAEKEEIIKKLEPTKDSTS